MHLFEHITSHEFLSDLQKILLIPNAYGNKMFLHVLENSLSDLISIQC